MTQDKIPLEEDNFVILPHQYPKEHPEHYIYGIFANPFWQSHQQAKTFLLKILQDAKDIVNYKIFNSEIKPHRFLQEGKDDECQICGFPQRFHQLKFDVELTKKAERLDEAILECEREFEEYKRKWGHAGSDDSLTCLNIKQLLQQIRDGKT